MPPASFKILKALGEGGGGEVFLVRTPEGAKVALKVFRGARSDLALFQKEFELLAKIRHPHIVSVLGFGLRSEEILADEDGKPRGPCYWMDYVEGLSLADAGRGQDKDVWEWFRQALSALDALHRQGVVHGDLSPSNVLIDAEGRLKIVDFGSAVLVGSGNSVAEPTAATLPYLAPERLNGIVSPANDVFSLGTIVFEALTGEHPRGRSQTLHDFFQEVKSGKISAKFGSLEKKHPLEARVLRKMIEAEPARRFANAGQVLQALQNPESKEAGTAPFYPVEMVGCEAPFQRVVKALGSGGPSIFLLHGPSGVGRSRFLRELGLQAQLSGKPCRQASASEWRQALSDLSGRPGLLLIPSLNETPVQELALLWDLPRDLSRTAPGVVGVIEWNDDHLTPEKRRFLEEWGKHYGLEEIRLGNFSRKEALKLLRQGFDDELAEELVDRLTAHTGGNPALIVELVGFLQDKQSRERRRFSPAWLENFPRLRRVQDLWAYRLTSLAPDERRILLAMAVAASPVTLKSLNDVVALEKGWAEISRLAGLGWIQREDDHWSLALPGQSAAVLDRASKKEIRTLHEKWLVHFKAVPEATVARVRHALALGGADAVEQELRKAAETLLSENRRTEALEMLESGLPFVGHRDEKSRLFRIRINLLNALGRFDAALTVCEEWKALDGQDEPAATRELKYWFTTALLHQNLNHDDEAAGRYRRFLDLADEREKAQRPLLLRCHAQLGLMAMRAADLEKAQTSFEKALSFPEAVGGARAEILRHLAELRSRAGDWEGAKKLFAEALSLYESLKDTHGSFSTRLQEGNQAFEHEDLHLAESDYRAAERLAETRRQGFELGFAWANRGVLERRRGRLAEAVELAQKSLEVLRLAGNRDYIVEALRMHALTMAASGCFQDAALAVAEIKSLAGGQSYLLRQADEAEASLKEWRDGVRTGDIRSAPAWNLEETLRKMTREKKDPENLRKILAGIHKELPPALQVRFEGRADYREWMGNAPGEDDMSPSSMNYERLITELKEFNRELLLEANMEKLLKRLLEKAVELSGAENGLLLLKSDNAEGPLPGFRVAAAKQIPKKTIESEEFRPSLSAVKRALASGQTVITDNALLDRDFRQARSVQLQQLRSILALPLHGSEEILGVFYLDHRAQEGLFQPETLKILELFADMAALALQKSDMIERLTQDNSSLSRQVELKASELGMAQRELRDSRRRLKNEYGDIIGRSPKMLEVLSLVDRITDTKIPVWIYGESGTGKESIARALHFNSSRAGKPFVTENCGALPESLLESELFGHKKGSFTHATADKKGILEYADGGTIFLDEIADMSLALQSKLLRFLQEGEIRPIGANKVVTVDVRVVCASNKDLAALVEEGKFRQDLFFRLNGVTVNLPPLRERMEDLPLLVEHFAHSVDPEALRIFAKYDWPGNIRELQNTLQTAALFAEGGVILPKSLQFKPVLSGGKTSPKPAAPKKAPAEPVNEDLLRILTAIRDQGFHRGHAAKVLGISRRNLYTRLERYGVPRDQETLKQYIRKYLD